MVQPKQTCDICDAPAIVRISNDSGHGSAMRHLCLDCADAEERSVSRQASGLNHAVVLVVVGLTVLVMSTFADVLKFGEMKGFGKWQQLGVLLAAGGVLLGAMTSTSTVLVLGLITGVVALLADWLEFGNAGGFGGQQILGCALGAGLVAVGIFMGLREIGSTQGQ